MFPDPGELQEAQLVEEMIVHHEVLCLSLDEVGGVPDKLPRSL